MSDEISEIEGEVEMAFLESEGNCWHGKGIPLHDGATPDEWKQATRMGLWTIDSAPVLFYDNATEQVIAYDKSKVLYRSDTKLPLSTVGAGYKVVQPAEVIDFFSEVIEKMGFEMCTAGVLFGGRKFWAQANIGREVNILGKDRVAGKILLSTACDGSLATTGAYTTTRVVCNNTLQMALNGNFDRVKIPHSVQFNADQMKEQLGLANDSFTEWAGLAEAMAHTGITDAKAYDYFANTFQIYTDEDKRLHLDDRLQIAAKSKIVASCYELFSGEGKGSQLASAKGTVWGALNAVSEYSDHRRATKTEDARIDSAWFGAYNGFKNVAWDEAMLMVA